jgi:hypothetical protein
MSRSPILFCSHTVGRTGSCFNAHSDVLLEPHGIAALREPYAAVCCCVAVWDASNPFLLMPVLPRAMRGSLLRSRHRIPEPRPDVRSRPTEFRRRAAQTLEPLHPSGRYQRKGTERAMDD